MTLSAGDRLGSYEIGCVIGAGGMGTVYRALDTRLGRTVAIKLVKDVSTDPHARTRLLREAQHASALNHPNICTIYEIGEANGQPFIVMEHVEGRRLNEIASGGGVPLERVIGYGIQIIDAVAHAHDHGILHRDLKGLNVIITPEGRVKLLDFGLATRTWSAGAEYAPTIHLTHPDVLAGTIAYMAPEVLQGQSADVRSDIWALGTVLYELTTGTLPFNGQTEYALSAQILREPPQPLPARIPAKLSAIIGRCLTKDPNERYQRASEVRAALDATVSSRGAPPVRWGRTRRGRAVVAALAGILSALGYMTFVGGPVHAVSSIAVMPFVNDGSDPDSEYLSDGITESVINSLAQMPQPRLKVIAFSSVLEYKKGTIDPQAIGRELAVETIVLGRVVHRSNVLSVSAELVSVRDKGRIWGETYNTKMADILSVQEDLAAKIFDNLRLRLTEDTKKKLTKPHTANVEAYQLYLKGRYVLNKYTEDGWTKAVEYFRQALEIEPGFALAWAGLADAYYQLSSLVLLPGEAIPKARAAAMRALEIDESLAEAHAALGKIKSQYDWDRPGAEREFRRAIQLNPSYAAARQSLGMYLFTNAQFDGALTEFRRARELDPLSVEISVTEIWPLLGLERYEDALLELRRDMELHPDVPMFRSYSHDVRGQSYLVRGMFDEAFADLVLGWDMNFVTGGGPEAIAALTDAYKASGMTGYWQKELELASAYYRTQVEQARAQSVARYVTPYKLAGLYIRVGDTNGAFALLDEAYKNRDENILFVKAESMTASSPWRSVATDPRLLDLIRRLGLGGSAARAHAHVPPSDVRGESRRRRGSRLAHTALNGADSGGRGAWWHR